MNRGHKRNREGPLRLPKNRQATGATLEGGSFGESQATGEPAGSMLGVPDPFAGDLGMAAFAFSVWHGCFSPRHTFDFGDVSPRSQEMGKSP